MENGLGEFVIKFLKDKTETRKIIKCDDFFQLVSDMGISDDSDEIISIMLENKYGTKIIDEDVVFIKKCSDVVENIKSNKTVDLETLDEISFHSDDEGSEKIGFIF